MCESLRRFCVYENISQCPMVVRCSFDRESSFDITYTQTMNKQSMKIEWRRQDADTHLFTVRSKRLTAPPTTEAVSTVVWVAETEATRNEKSEISMKILRIFPREDILVWIT